MTLSPAPEPTPTARPDSAPGKGLLIVFEGIDGAGKSTHLRRLAHWLDVQGLDHVAQREPTDGPHGQRLRALAAKGRDAICPEEECRLFLLDRRDDVEHNIRPALEAGRIVLLDRYYFSTMAYQGALGLDVWRILRQNESFAPQPDLVLYLDANPEVALNRIRKGRDEGPNLFEKGEYLAQVRALFQSFQFPFWRTIDSDAAPDQVFAAIASAARALLEARGRL